MTIPLNRVKTGNKKPGWPQALSVPKNNDQETDLQDDDPVLDEEDMEENDLTDKGLEEIEWEEPQKPDVEIHNPEKDLKI